MRGRLGLFEVRLDAAVDMEIFLDETLRVLIGDGRGLGEPECALPVDDAEIDGFRGSEMSGLCCSAGL